MLCRWHSLRSNHRVCSRLLHDASQRSLTLPRPIIRYVNQRFINHSASKWVDTSRSRRKDLIPTTDTIYALSTAPGRAAIAIIRISGPACLDIYGGLCPQRPFPVPRVATLRKLFDPVYTHEIIDPGALVLYFPAPKTVTGEDLLELHIHGGPAIVRSLLQAIPRCIDTRPRRRTAEYSLIRAAEPGEFTKRAFYNGVIDLTQAEALGETLAAETEQQRKLAVTGSDGGMAVRYEQWRQQLLYARGEMEALIDFSEDQHFDESPATFLKSISNQIKILERQIELHIENANRGELLRSGISVALLGAPNAGKSSLLNQIVGREAAIVSSEPGTTRDIVDVQVDIGGWLVKLGDMAGLRTGNHYLPDAVARDANSTLHDISLVEQEGIRRARERALHADVIIALIPLQRSTGGAVTPSIDREVLQAVRQCQASGKAILYVVNKTDLMSADDEHGQRGAVLDLLVSALPGATKSNVVFVSCRDAALQTGRDPGGVQAFLTHLMTVFSMVTSAATGVPAPETSAEEAQAYWSASLSVTHRQSTYLRQCLNNLRDFQCMHDASTTRGADQCRGLEGRLASSVDDHVDLVGEVVEETASSGLTDQCDRISAVAAPGDHPPLSADYGLGHLGESLDTNRNREVDIVQAAEHLRYAADCLAKITGRGAGADVEEVLGVVFEK